MLMSIKIPDLALTEWVPVNWKKQQSRMARQFASVVAQAFDADFSQERDSLTFLQTKDGAFEICALVDDSDIPKEITVVSFHPQVSLTDKPAHGSNTDYSVLEISYLDDQNQKKTRLLRVDRQNLKGCDPEATDEEDQWPGLKYNPDLRPFSWETQKMQQHLPAFTAQYQYLQGVAKIPETEGFTSSDYPGVAYSALTRLVNIGKKLPSETNKDRLRNALMVAWYLTFGTKGAQMNAQKKRKMHNKTRFIELRQATNNLLETMRLYKRLAEDVRSPVVNGMFLIELLLLIDGVGHGQKSSAEIEKLSAELSKFFPILDSMYQAMFPENSKLAESEYQMPPLELVPNDILNKSMSGDVLSCLPSTSASMGSFYTCGSADDEIEQSLVSIGSPPLETSIFDNPADTVTNGNNAALDVIHTRPRANATAHLHGAPATVSFWGIPFNEEDTNRLLDACSL